MNAIRIVIEVTEDTIHIPNMGEFKGKRVELIIVPMNDDREELLFASASNLARAYGTNEPDYSDNDVCERNTSYEKR